MLTDGTTILSSTPQNEYWQNTNVDKDGGKPDACLTLTYKMKSVKQFCSVPSPGNAFQKEVYYFNGNLSIIRSTIVVFRLGRLAVAGTLGGSFANAILRESTAHSSDLHLQASRDLALLIDNRRLVVERHVVEQHLQEHIRDADQIMILLILEERI